MFLQDSCKYPHLFSFLIETPPHSWFDKSVISEPIPRLIMTRPFIPSWHKKHYAPAHVTSNSSRLSKENDSHMRNVQKKETCLKHFGGTNCWSGSSGKLITQQTETLSAIREDLKLHGFIYHQSERRSQWQTHRQTIFHPLVPLSFTEHFNLF